MTEAADKQPRPAAFLDRDGVLNVDHGYTFRPEELELMPSAAVAVRLFNAAGYTVIVVTNQAGVARGYYSEDAVKAFNAHMREALQAQGARIDAFYYCPHHPDGMVKEFAIRCDCRKPAPGMLEQAARDWPIDRARSILIGDKDDDVAAAKAFGIRGVKFDAKAGTLEDLVRKTLAPADL
jgi:D-glycero-D-manno-heptose 1,7-bisphosphate phosphatase